jgi:glucose-6-phosphate isomerase
MGVNVGSLRLDYAFCLEEVLGQGRGLSAVAWHSVLDELAGVHARLEEQRRIGNLGFWKLPQMPVDQRIDITEEAERLRSLADDLVVLGIGGSALGPTAVDMALSGTMRQVWPRREGAMRLFVADNPDPRAFGGLLEKLDLRRTVFNVVSKSGSTAETMAQFMVVRQRLEDVLSREEAFKRIVFTTDPEAGNLRLLARGAAYACLPVPPNVGGRYSVLSAAGLLPLACVGYDVTALLAGAGEMAARCQEKTPRENPAYVFAALAVANARQGRNILVMMPYATDLFGLAQWFVQLWAESLGKARHLDGSPAHVGQTPVAAVGATDQHSQLQLYMEGPQDKQICFITLDNYGADLEIPPLFGDIEALSYLDGRTLAELIQAEATATAAALAQEGRPSLALRLPAINEHVLGQIIFMLEAATVAAAGLLHVDPLDQPGVELGKKFTYGLMGRKGFDEYRPRLESMRGGAEFLV